MEIISVAHQKNVVPICFDSEERVIEAIGKWSISMSVGAKKKSPNTVNLYLKNIGYFVDWLRKHEVFCHLSADDALASVTQGGVKEYLAELEASGLERSTIRNRDITIKTFMDWLTTADAGRIREKSTHDDKLLSHAAKSKIPEYLNESQLIEFLLGFHNESQRCFVQLIYDVGYRRSELVRALWKDFHEIDGWPEKYEYLPLVVRGSKRKGGKVEKRISIISRPMINRVRRYHNSIQYRRHANKWSDNERPAFFNVKGEPLSYNAIGDGMRLASKRTGMSIHPHILRHGCAYNIMRSEHGKSLTDNLVLVKKQFGHAFITSTEAYTQIPAVLLTKLGLTNTEKMWFERSEKVVKATYLPARSHREKRGH